MRDLPHPFWAKQRRHGEWTLHRSAKRPARDRCTHGCGGPVKGPWFCNKYRLRLAYANSFDAARPLPVPRPRSKNRNATIQAAPARPGPANYLISTLAPASSNFFLIEAASSLLTPSLTVFGAPSTRSLASLRPRLVTSRTALMTLILLPPTSVSTTENYVFSSAGA